MKFEFAFPFFLVKSKRFVDSVYRAGKKYNRFLQRVGDLSIAVGLLGMVTAMVFLVKGAIKILGGAPAQVAIAIPGIQVPGSSFFLPLWSGLAAIFLLAIVHEGMHALMASSVGIKPNSFAFVLLLFIPAAGVDLNEKKINNTSKRNRLRIFSAGSFGNFVLAIFAFLAIIPAGQLFTADISYDGMLVLNSTNPELVLPTGSVITSINGTDTKSLSGVQAFLENSSPGDYVLVETLNGSFTGRLADSNGQAKLNAYLQPLFHSKTILGKLALSIIGFLNILFQLNLGVGLINLLPVGFLDGGRMLKDLSSSAFKLINPAMLALLAFNIFGPWLLNILH